MAGRYAYLAAGSPGLLVVDVSDPRSPRQVGQYDTPRSARTVRLSGSYAYVGDLKWVRIFDVSEPSAPREVSSYKMPAEGHDLWVAGGTAYVAAYDAGLIVLGLEGGEGGSPTRPTTGSR